MNLSHYFKVKTLFSLGENQLSYPEVRKSIQTPKRRSKINFLSRENERCDKKEVIEKADTAITTDYIICMDVCMH